MSEDVAGFVAGILMTIIVSLGISKCTTYTDRNDNLKLCIEKKWVEPKECVNLFGDGNKYTETKE